MAMTTQGSSSMAPRSGQNVEIVDTSNYRNDIHFWVKCIEQMIEFLTVLVFRKFYIFLLNSL